MTYFQGFVIPVMTESKQAYLDMVRTAAPIFTEYGAMRTVECWGDDVMDGKIIDFKKAVRANDNETVVFSWVCWPDKATCDAAAGKIMADDRMRPDGPMPFDGQRLIYAGFEVTFDTGGSGPIGYVDGVVASVPVDNRQGFIDHAAATARFFQEQGALRIVDGWGIDVPAGKVTGFKSAVQAQDGETVVFPAYQPRDPTQVADFRGSDGGSGRMAAISPITRGESTAAAKIVLLDQRV